jgi:chemotaxis-related protein WspB
MLLLVFRVAGEAYGLEAARVVEVVPCALLRTLPHAPDMVAGLLRYRRRTVPILDLGRLLGGGGCRQFLSTRIILVEQQSPAGAGALLGLMAEHVTELQQVAAERVAEPPSLFGQNPYLDAIVSTDGGLVPLIAVDRLLAGPLRQALAEAAP